MLTESFHPDSATPTDDLRWLAHRYVSGDLSEAESEDFEARLAEALAAGDASLGELVAQAVVLNRAVATVCAVEPTGLAETAVQPGSADAVAFRATQRALSKSRISRFVLATVGAVAILSVAVVVSRFVLRSGTDSDGLPAGRIAESQGTGDRLNGEEAKGNRETDGARAHRLVSLWRRSEDVSGQVGPDDEDGPDGDGPHGDGTEETIAEIDAMVPSDRVDEDFEDDRRTAVAAAGSSSSRAEQARSDYRLPAWLLAAVAAGSEEESVDPMPALPDSARPAPRPQEN